MPVSKPDSALFIKTIIGSCKSEARVITSGQLVFQVTIFLTAGFVLFLGLGLVKEWFLDTRNRMPVSEWLVVGGILLAIALAGFMEGLALGTPLSSALFIFKYSLLPVVRFRETGVEQRSSVDRSPTAIIPGCRPS